MQLVHMDVDRLGAGTRANIGPLSPGLNAVCGSKGSGKTTLLKWLRQSFDDVTHDEHSRDWNGRASYAERLPLAGRVEILSRNARFELERDTNGRIRFAQVGWNPSTNYTEQRAHQGANISAKQRRGLAGLAAASESAHPEAELQELARSLGLDHSTNVDFQSTRARLLNQEVALQRELERATNLRTSRQELLERRHALEAELTQAKSDPRHYRKSLADRGRLLERYDAIEVDLRNSVAELERLDQQIAAMRAELKLHETNNQPLDVGESYRVQLQQLEDRLNRWRQTLRDLKLHRERIETNATDVRLDRQIGDQISTTKHADPRAALRSLEAQMLSTKAQLDTLVDRYGSPVRYRDADGRWIEATSRDHHDERARSRYNVERDAYGRTRVAYSEDRAYIADAGELPAMLQRMQQDLHEVCQQLARHEATTSSDALKQQTLQLKRCEAELLQSVEQLIMERGELLRKIADDYNLSTEQVALAFGEWCQCNDHGHLRDWLLQDDTPTTCRTSDAAGRQRLIDDIERLTAERKQLALRVEECRRQVRDTDSLRRGSLLSHDEFRTYRGRPEHEILRDLDAVVRDLTDHDRRQQVETELAEVRRQLTGLPRTEDYRNSRFQDEVDRHIVGLMGTSLRRAKQTVERDYTQRRYDTINGVVVEQPSVRREYDVPNAIVQTALRLTIAEGMAERNDAIPLLIDEVLDTLPSSIQASVIEYLANYAARKHQVVIVSGDEGIANLVSRAGGSISRLDARRTPVAPDINRQLLAVANDQEADKWQRPHIERQRSEQRVVQDQFYLHDQSRIEDLPSIDPTSAARCRAVGVDIIGDLMDVDPAWLADNVRLDGINEATIANWQSEARLLCTVRNLRPFDARVLVGAGIRNSQQLSSVEPSRLYERVESFLETDRGRRILQSGSSYELSRITKWISAAKNSSGRIRRSSYDRSRSSSSSSSRNGTIRNYDHDRSRDYDYEYHRNGRDGYDRDNDYERGSRTRSDRSRSSRSNRSSRSRSSRSSASASRSRSRRDYQIVERNGRQREYTRTERPSRERVRIASETQTQGSDTRLKFYLELSSPVVDAPSIGPRMAARLEKCGILTVDQLLAANPESLADKLNHRRVDAETIRAWQHQARLVCRIPNLRGHDAQMLVACEMTSPEELATMDAEHVLTQVLAFAQSSDGQRILRGSKEPDLAEVKDWISWAASCRSLNAA